jgi:hypothetical protein
MALKSHIPPALPEVCDSKITQNQKLRSRNPERFFIL